MTLKKFIASVAVGASLLLPSYTAAQSNIPIMTQAVISAYTDMIAEDPADYMSYFSRGTEYYNVGDYIKALDDINSALRYCPASEEEFKFQCYITRANINDQLHRYFDALNDLNSALAFSPDCISCIYQLGNVQFELGNYKEASELYQKVERAMPRNREAKFGLARVAVKQNNYGLAANYCDEAVDLMPNDSEGYIQRALVRGMMSNYEGAVDDYITAINVDDRAMGKALRQLVALGKTNYPAVINGLTRAINNSKLSGAYLYIRASIAQAHGNYLSAISDLETIINNNLDGYAGLNYSLAECYYALGRYETALSNIDYALGTNSDNPEYYAMKARIRNAMGDYDGALFAAEKSLEKDPNCVNALEQKAIAQKNMGNYNEASVTLAEAMMTDADNAYVYLMRAWIAAEYHSNNQLATTLCERVLDLQNDFDKVETLRGFAQIMLGDNIAAERWMNEVLDANVATDGRLNYYAACLYARIGNNAKALAFMEASLRDGYANYHNWVENTEAGITVASIRQTPEFKELMKKYAAIFGR